MEYLRAILFLATGTAVASLVSLGIDKLIPMVQRKKHQILQAIAVSLLLALMTIVITGFSISDIVELAVTFNASVNYAEKLCVVVGYGLYHLICYVANADWFTNPGWVQQDHVHKAHPSYVSSQLVTINLLNRRVQSLRRPQPQPVVSQVRSPVPANIQTLSPAMELMRCALVYVLANTVVFVLPTLISMFLVQAVYVHLLNGRGFWLNNDTHFLIWVICCWMLTLAWYIWDQRSVRLLPSWENDG